MRCPDCNKFVSYDTEMEPEGYLVVSGDTVNGLYTRTLTCGECGTDLKTAELEVEYDLTEDLELAGKTLCSEDPEGDHEWQVEEEHAEPTTEYEGKGRGTRTYYGIEVTAKLICANCGTTVEITEGELTAREQASSFDEC